MYYAACWRVLFRRQLARIFFATEFTRHLDRSGYIRFRRWRISAEEGRGLATSSGEFLHQHAAAIEYQDTELADLTH